MGNGNRALDMLRRNWISDAVTSGVGIIFALFEATREESARSDSYALLHPCNVFGDDV